MGFPVVCAVIGTVVVGIAVRSAAGTAGLRLLPSLLLLSLLLCCGEDSQSRSASLSLSQDFHDFGEVSEGTTLQYDFEIRNESDHEVNIVAVRVSCDCSVAEAQLGILAAGEARTVRFSYDTIGSQGEGLGHVRVIGEGEVEATFRFRLVVEQYLTKNPPHLHFGRVPKSASARRELIVKSSDGEAFDLDIDAVSPPGILVDSCEDLSGGERRSWKLTFQMQPAQLEQSPDEVLVISVPTTHPRQPWLRIEGAGLIVPDTEYDPFTALSFGRIDGTKLEERSIRVINHHPTRLLQVQEVGMVRLKSAPEDPNDALGRGLIEVESREVEEGQAWEVVVRLLPGVPFGMLPVQLEVHTNDPDEPVRRIPVWATCTRKS